MLSFIEFGRNADGSMYWGKPAEGTGGKTADEAFVQEHIANNEMVVFSSNGCPYCAEAIHALKRAGFSPAIVEVATPQKRVLADMCGDRSVPKVFVKGSFIGGCNDGGMGGVMTCLGNGKIDELMAKKA